MAIEEMLASGAIQDIAAFITACEFPPEAFVLVERLPQEVIANRQERQDLLRFARLDNGLDPGRYTSGRVFHPDFELRWEREMHRTRVVYLGQARKLPELQMIKLREEWQPRQSNYYLFGASLDAFRLAQKIGRASCWGRVFIWVVAG